MRKIRVLVVDDSVVIRRLVREILESDPRIEVVAVARDGKIALAKLRQTQVDLVTLDIEMPVLNGLERIAEACGRVLVQDPAACVAPGMPRRVLEASVQSTIHHPDAISAAILRQVVELSADLGHVP